VNRPRLKLGSHLVSGLAAVALFAVLAAVFLTAPFGDPAGLVAEGSITAAIGYALIDRTGLAAFETEGFLVALLVVGVVLDAALDGALLLAKSESGGRIVTALRTGTGDGSRTDGGDRETGRSDGGRE
jgi:NADH-quinone oxidoreductase subunit J